jgi:hypothetical protein
MMKFPVFLKKDIAKLQKPGNKRRDQSKACSTFKTSQTFPTRSGSGLRVVLSGCHPEGVAYAPLIMAQVSHP